MLGKCVFLIQHKPKLYLTTQAGIRGPNFVLPEGHTIKVVHPVTLHGFRPHHYMYYTAHKTVRGLCRLSTAHNTPDDLRRLSTARKTLADHSHSSAFDFFESAAPHPVLPHICLGVLCPTFGLSPSQTSLQTFHHRLSAASPFHSCSTSESRRGVKLWAMAFGSLAFSLCAQAPVMTAEFPELGIWNGVLTSPPVCLRNDLGGAPVAV